MGQVLYIGLDLFLHLINGASECPDLVLVLNSFREFPFGRHIFSGKPAGLFRDLFNRPEQHPLHEKRVDNDRYQRQIECGQCHFLYEGVSGIRHRLHLPLHAEDRLCLPIRTDQRDHCRDMRVCFNITLVADHELLIAFSFIQGFVFFRVLRICRLPVVSEVVMRIIIFVVDR